MHQRAVSVPFDHHHRADLTDNVPYLDAAAVLDEAGKAITFFLVNRNAGDSLEATFDLQGFGKPSVLDHQTIKYDDLEARNTLAKPETVVPRKATGAVIEDGKLKFSLAPLSYTMLRAGV